MKPFVATLLAAALSAACASAYAAGPDQATYRTMTQKATADFKLAAAKCTGMSGNERAVCVEEAKVTRARANADAVAQYNNTLKARSAARTALANAEYALAKVRCSVSTGAGQDSCLANARSAHVAALADVKADRELRVAANAAVDDKGLVANARTSDPAKAAAVDKCARIAGQPTTGCLIDNKDSSVAATAAAAREAGATVAQKTENMAEAAVDKTKEVATNIAGKTEQVAGNAAARTGKVVADSVITTKIKADLFKEPELSAMSIHVETEKGVVMLSGFVDSKADAEKAVRLAKSVEGVTRVESAIKVK